MMRFDWDDGKDAKNFAKHGIEFETAKTIWTDPYCLEYFDILHSLGEDRFIRIGHAKDGRLLTVVFAEQKDQIRVISARRATPAERKSYEERI